MSQESPVTAAAQCFNCGFEAPADDEQWARVDHPTLGTLTQCPDCESTDITTV